MYAEGCVIRTQLQKLDRFDTVQGGPIKTAHVSDTIFLQPLQI